MYLILTVLISLLAHLCLGQHSNLKFNTFTTREGLSNNYVTNILEDSKGFMWFATNEGLNRYNGYKCDVFSHDRNDENSIPNNFLLCLAEDSLANIWAGSIQMGLACYSITRNEFTRYTHTPGDETSVPGPVVRDIHIDYSNNVWVAADGGLAKFNRSDGTFSRLNFPVENTMEFVVDVKEIFQISEKELFVQSNLGFYKVDLTTEKINKVEFSEEWFDSIRNKETAVLLDRDYNLWVGAEEGLYRYNLKSNTYKLFTKSGNGLSSVNVSVIFQDSHNNIWVGTKDKGLNFYNSKTDNFASYLSSGFFGNSISNNIITDIYEDRDGNLWIATQEGGVNYLQIEKSYFEHFYNDPSNNKSISSNKLSAFYEDKFENIWIGSGNGTLNKLTSQNDFIRTSIPEEVNAGTILGITSLGGSSIFLTGWNVGLYEYDVVENTFINRMQNLPLAEMQKIKNIKGLGVDHDGNIWLASHIADGIAVYDPQSHIFYTPSNPGKFNQELLSVPYAAYMMEDSKKRIWIIAYTGLYMYDGEFHTFKTSPADSLSLSSDYLYTLFEDSKKNLWVGSTNGLDKIHEKDNVFTFERLSDKCLIPNNIKGILEDNSGNLWLSSNLELTQFNPETKKIKHYKINKELPGQEFFERSCMKTSKGEMYFGGTSGFFRFMPDSISKFNKGKKVHIVDLLLFNKSQSPDKPNSPLKKSILETTEIELAHNQSVISFEYLAINFNQYKSYEYAYMLEGFDNDWYFVNDKRSVTYTNLPPGTYVFKVTTANGDELSDQEPTELRIIILPPFYKTLPAYLIYIVLFMLFLHLFRWEILNREKLQNELKLEKVNIKNIRESNLMKLRFFTNISHEFRTPLTLIKVPLEKLRGSFKNLSEEDVKYSLDLIQKSSDRLLRMVNQLMDYRKLEAGSLVLEASQGDIVEFCKNSWSTFSFLAEQKHIEYNFIAQPDSFNMSFDPDKMDKILTNLLSNAFKFTPDHGSISLSVSIVEGDLLEGDIGDGGVVKIVVKDNGLGIKEKDLPQIFDRFFSVSKTSTGKIEGTGIGLTLAKELVELHQGTISVASKEGEGAEFIVVLPVNVKIVSTDVENLPIEHDNKPVEAEILNLNIDKQIDGHSGLKKQKVLLVEDDAELRGFLYKELRADYDVLLAKDGDEGLRMAFLDIPDLIISDVTMPQMDGFELCKTLKSDERTSHLPVILLTAKHSQENQLEGLDAGADDYMFKPFSITVLRMRIQNLLNVRKEIIEKFKHGTSLFFTDERVEDKDRELLQSAINVILENITNENLNAEFIAKKLLISRSLVYLKIEAVSGQTVNEFIRNIRLKKSLRLLAQNKRSITEIAYEVGFSSQSYYTRSFTKLFGVSPKDYILQDKKDLSDKY
jgi:signal transduction histidine kinase/ligand-binding sensor domain-containing protein/DNA-binding response OmpR family regulator